MEWSITTSTINMITETISSKFDQELLEDTYTTICKRFFIQYPMAKIPAITPILLNYTHCCFLYSHFRIHEVLALTHILDAKLYYPWNYY